MPIVSSACYKLFRLNRFAEDTYEQFADWISATFHHNAFRLAKAINTIEIFMVLLRSLVGSAATEKISE